MVRRCFTDCPQASQLLLENESRQAYLRVIEHAQRGVQEMREAGIAGTTDYSAEVDGVRGVLVEDNKEIIAVYEKCRGPDYALDLGCMICRHHFRYVQPPITS